MATMTSPTSTQAGTARTAPTSGLPQRRGTDCPARGDRQAARRRRARPVTGRPVRPVVPPRSTAVRPTAVRPTAARPTAARPAARLTRRGRITVLLVLAVLLFTAFSLGRAASEAASEPVATAQLEQTTVLPGDTLWAVARRIAPEHDPREVIDSLRRLNDLPSSQLRAGQQLLLPATG